MHRKSPMLVGVYPTLLDLPYMQLTLCCGGIVDKSMNYLTGSHKSLSLWRLGFPTSTLRDVLIEPSLEELLIPEYVSRFDAVSYIMAHSVLQTTTCCYYGTLHLEATKVLADFVHAAGTSPIL